MVREGGMARTPYSSSQDIQMDVLDNAALQVTPPEALGTAGGGGSTAGVGEGSSPWGSVRPPCPPPKIPAVVTG